MARGSFETAMMLLVTGLTNLCMLPAIVNLHRQEYVFEEFIGTFTMVTSFLYHCCDSIDGPIWLTEGQWHRLDNIGSIMSFIIWAIHLMDLPDPLHQRYLQYLFLALVLVFQEKNPWDEFNSYMPILLCFFVLSVSFAVRRRIPRYDWTQLARGIFFLFCGVCCFVRGLDDDNDPFRFFHGCWHAFIGASAYCNFRILPRKNGSASTWKFTHLPVKKY